MDELKWTKSSTETVDPNRVTPNAERADPVQAKARTLRALPNEKVSKAEVLLAK